MLSVDPDIDFDSDLAFEYGILPKRIESGRLELFTDRTLKNNELRELEVLTGYSIQYKVISKDTLREELVNRFKSPNSSLNMNGDLPSQFEGILIDAIDLKASDIHLEPGLQGGIVRYRIDGKLFNRQKVESDRYPGLVNRIKILAGLDITQKRLPQDGRIQKGEKEADLRVSSIPTSNGEKLVIRILKKEAGLNRFADLGMNEAQVEKMTMSISHSYGLVLVSGPTGSGKSTTLYSALKQLATPERNVMTIEDPIESTIAGITQVQVDEKLGLGFSTALRSFLRQDPDVIMVGEIRDKETGEICVRAALTGHLVLSTVHTNSAWGIIERLIDLGIPSYLLSSTLNLLVAQRLIRLLCDQCKQKEPTTSQRMEFPFSTFNARGCENCYYSGYKGRIAIYEMISPDKVWRNWVRKNGSQPQENKNGYGNSSLKNQAIELVRAGKTSIDEVLGLVSMEI